VRPSGSTAAPLGPPTPTSTPGNNGLQYDPSTRTYSYIWRTLSSYTGTCQRFTLKLNDGTTHTALFQFS
jgi:hypothetical protein